MDFRAAFSEYACRTLCRVLVCDASVLFAGAHALEAKGLDPALAIPHGVKAVIKMVEQTVEEVDTDNDGLPDEGSYRSMLTRTHDPLTLHRA